MSCDVHEHDDNERMEQFRRLYHAVLGPFAQWYGSVHLFVRPVICCVGVLANLAVVVVLLRKNMRGNVFNVILTAIAFWDMGLMGSYFVWGLVPTCHPVFFSYWWNVYTMCYANFSVVAHSASLWSTVLMAALRVLILRNSQRASASYDNVRTALLAIGAACALAILGSIPNFLRNQIIDYGITRMPLECYPTNSSLRRMHVYSLEQPAWWSCTWERANFWITGVLFKIIPCILLTVFMTMLVHLLLEAGRRRQRMLRDRTNQSSLTTLHTDRTTKMLVLIMLVFLVTELPQGAVVVALGIEPTVVFVHEHLGDILDLMSLINSTVNFVLYVAMSSEFREQFALTFQVCSRPVMRLCTSMKRRPPSRNGYVSALQNDTRLDLTSEPVTNL